MADLLKEQDKLRKQALAVIEKLDLNNILSKYGQFSLVGSIKYGLMTWRDIDVDLEMQTDPTDSEYWEIVKTFFSFPKVKSVTLVDNRKQVEMNRPKSMYLGIKYEDNENNIWKIDIRLLAKESIAADKVTQLIEDKITGESRLAILQIKSQLHDNPKYHKVFSSADIYEAVLLSDVKDLSDFGEYLSKKGKGL
jgi:hypothetical protein